MRRVLPAPQSSRTGFAGFLPRLGERQPATLFAPATVTDRSDGKIAHLDGLNLTRAWAGANLALMSRADRRAPPRGEPAARRGRLHGIALAVQLRAAGARNGEPHMKTWVLVPALLLAAFADKPLGTAGRHRSLGRAPTGGRSIPRTRSTWNSPAAASSSSLRRTSRRTPSPISATLARQGYFDGLSINRVQENYVVQWGDPAEDEAAKRPFGKVAATLAPEFERPAAGAAFTPIPGPDGYADEVGYSDGFAAARRGGKAWLTHCYGVLGVGRGDTADSGNGSELYVVIGSNPRNLDRNIAVAGRVMPASRICRRCRAAPARSASTRSPNSACRFREFASAATFPRASASMSRSCGTDTATFASYVDARAHRSRDGWYLADQNFIDLCNVRVPQREIKRP